jgi:hypothetical protein
MSKRADIAEATQVVSETFDSCLVPECFDSMAKIEACLGSLRS